MAIGIKQILYLSKGLKKSNTTVNMLNNGDIEIYYYQTKIVYIEKGTGVIGLNNGSHYTKSAKDRINQVLDYLNLPIRVFQQKKEWYAEIKYENNEISLYKFNKDGQCIVYLALGKKS